MKNLILLVLALSCTACYSQQAKQHDDPLRVYSYLILHIKDGSAIGNSTGFFIREQNKLFFITTYHTCTCVDIFKKEVYPNEWDTLKVRIYNIKNEVVYMPILIEGMKKNRKIEYFFKKTDICIYEIKHLTENTPVYSIEKYLTTMGSTNPVQTIFWGYPTENNDSDTITAEFFRPVKNEGKLRFNIDIPLTFYDDSTTIVDSTTLAITPSNNKGASGSPVFFRYKVREMEVTTFGGMVFGTSESENITYVVRPELIIQRIRWAAQE